MEQSGMHKKLAEARYFRRRMDEHVNDPVFFKYEMSAFLTAARTVMQYLHKECKKKGRRCKKWYDHQISKGSNKTLRFLRCKRNVNIHEHPIEPQQRDTLAITETITLGESFSISLIDEDGNVVQREVVEHTPSEPVPTKIEQKVEYRFEDWLGQEDVLELCDMYVAELQAILDEWGQAPC